MRRKNKKHLPPEDVEQARRLREEAAEQIKAVRGRNPEVVTTVAQLSRRRGENHFIDLLGMYAKDSK